MAQRLGRSRLPVGSLWQTPARGESLKSCAHESTRAPGRMRGKNMRIGELSRKVGVNLQTIRFYERKGLLREPQRTSDGYRDCTTADLEQVRFIRECQQLGFTLK